MWFSTTLYLKLTLLLLTSFSASSIDGNKCGDQYEYDATTPGTISSPFYGEKNRYQSDLMCDFKITAPENHRIKLTFKDFDIVLSSGCIQDYFAAFGKHRTSILGVHCGSELPRPILSNKDENEIELTFRTGFVKRGRGFLIQYESSPYFTSICDPGFKECANRKCYQAEQKCNGVDDCGDGTDEQDCGQIIDTRPEECGVAKIEPNTDLSSVDRMVGGEEAIPNSWPWQVSLQSSWKEPNGHFCGGTLINAQWVLTASHCVVANRFPGLIKLHFGSHNKFNRTQYEQVRISSKVISYPDLQGEEIVNYNITDDISLIKLNAPIEFNNGVQPACLPPFGLKPEFGWRCFATGWGETRGTGGSDVLKQSEQVVQSTNNCTFNTDTQICVGQANKSPCHGDSGGPLSCLYKDKWFVFGAASYVTTANYMGGLCTGPGAMTVFANIAHKADWIEKTINKFT